MSELFLSASVPDFDGREYYETANPFLIQFAVRELVSATIRDHTIVWGGHPAITPMILAVCEDLGVEYEESVVLYQSDFFVDRFPKENKHFRNVIRVPAVEGNLKASLTRMRTQMLSRKALRAAVFIGGMAGVIEEYSMFRNFHPNAPVLALGAPGGAARSLCAEIRRDAIDVEASVDFADIFRSHLLPMLG